MVWYGVQLYDVVRLYTAQVLHHGDCCMWSSQSALTCTAAKVEKDESKIEQPPCAHSLLSVQRGHPRFLIRSSCACSSDAPHSQFSRGLFLHAWVGHPIFTCRCTAIFGGCRTWFHSSTRRCKLSTVRSVQNCRSTHSRYPPPCTTACLESCFARCLPTHLIAPFT